MIAMNKIKTLILIGPENGGAYRVNKKAAGSMLDGTYYKEMPLIFHPTLST